jgi:hypothetical protein
MKLLFANFRCPPNARKIEVNVLHEEEKEKSSQGWEITIP